MNPPIFYCFFSIKYHVSTYIVHTACNQHNVWLTNLLGKPPNHIDSQEIICYTAVLF